MKDLLQSLADGLNKPPEALPDQPILVYGAGSRGREVAAFLVDRGYDVLGFADAAASGRDSWRQLRIRTLSDWQRETLPPSATMVLAIHNHQVDMAALINDLGRSMVCRIVNPVEFQALFDGEFPAAYWLAGPGVYRGREANLVRLDAVLADEFSRDLLRRVVEFRLTGRYDVLPQPTPREQYCPANLPRWRNPMRLVDGGAFVGDTLEQLQRNGYDFEQIVAFEPDPENYARLSRRMRDMGPGVSGVCLPCGLGAQAELLRFASDGTGASRVSQEGQQIIQCVSIDDALPGMRPTLIKLDIEGGEPAALQGAIQTITASRPALAISIYHHPHHLWEIPLLIDSWQLGYKLYLGVHGFSSFDLVLYGVPDE
ncbi:FkbM family methyltransferase [Accumulibacter sp.]|uniref:FkbM family methyltransferase n=1 Tax=Accumulibacter sp. TaxID=2053492 RepID=UPI0028C48C8F|nr:FkbM family methyltransferase [Accumulibacter sp.]